MINPEVHSFYPQDSRIEQFRLNVLREDLQVEPSFVDQLSGRNEILKHFHDHEHVEEIYKFSKTKWLQLKCDKFLALLDDNQVVSISGVRTYSNQFVRLGMHYYTLKKFRRIHRSILWRSNGFLEQTLIDYPDKNDFFISIYSHNKKLKAWVKYLQNGMRFGQLSQSEAGVTSNLKRFSVLPEILFNEVPQTLLFYSKNGTSAKDLIKTLR